MGALAERIEHTYVISSLASSNVGYGTFTVMHYFTLFALTGTALVFDLRLLDLVAKKQTLAEFADEIFPWIWATMGLALFSGTVLWLTDGGDYYYSPVMREKILIVLVAVALTIFMRRSVPRWNTSPTPALAKASAGVSLLLWFGAILWGNFIAALCGLG